MRINRLTPAVIALGLCTPVVAGSLPAHAAFPGSNGQLAFQLEAPAGDHTQNDIYTISPDGSQLKRLTATPNQHEFAPTWNAAGTRIAFWRAPAPFGPGAIWTMKANGGDARQLSYGIDARDPAWNAAGTRIAFTVAGPDGSDLWSMRTSDGGDHRQLTSGPALDFEPAWSPDGTRLAFTRGSQEGDVGDIYVLDLCTGVLNQVTSSPDYDHQVGWAPDGRRLVFERDTPRGFAIYTVNVDGSGLTRVTDGSFYDNGPAFSADGRLIAFGSNRSGAFLDDLWIVNADGTNLHPVRALPYSEGFPDWRPAPN